MGNLTERTNFVLDTDRARRLKELADRRGVPVAVILREAVDDVLRKLDDFDVDAFRKKYRVDEFGVEPGYFEALRDRSPAREVPF